MEYSENKRTTCELAAHTTKELIAPASTSTKSRVMGVDAARGLALLGMIAVHVSPDFNGDTPSMVQMLVAGKAVALFVLLAGISLTFITGSRAVEGSTRTAIATGLVVRALLIGLIGLALGYTGSSVNVILPYYGVLFLLAIPLIGLRPRVLACLAVVIAVVVPVFLLLVGDPIRNMGLDDDPTFHSFLQPYQLAIELLLTGSYPALAYMAYICAGLAIGRLQLSSIRVAVRLLVGGLVLAVCTWVTSSVLLIQMGGLQHLRAAAPAGTPPDQLTDNVLLWSSDHISSWWWLAVCAPYSATPLDLLHTIGVAMAVLGALLLLARVAAPVLRPLATAGSMVLTIYCIHVVYMTFDPLSDSPFLSFATQAATALVFALIWQRVRGRGPLETVVTVAAGRIRQAIVALEDKWMKSRPGNTVSKAIDK